VLDLNFSGTGFDAEIMNTRHLPLRQVCAEWSNRILLLSLLGIIYLTVFPFKFDFTPTYVFHRYPFLLETSVKRLTPTDFFLNVLLFVPFGFGLTAQMCKRGGSRWASFLAALGFGAIASYTVEVLQFYVPARDSGWADVISNATGSVVGFFLFERCGGAVLRKLAEWEAAYGSWLSPRRGALLLAAYFALSFGVSVVLQNQTRLSNWDPRCTLFVGNDASHRNPWRGQVFLLQIWNRALPEDTIRRLAGKEPVDNASAGLVASFDFSGAPPYRERNNLLPAFEWTPRQPEFTDSQAADFDARSWLRTELPVENLTGEIKRTNQFTIHFICAPAATGSVNGRIVSLSQSADNVNFSLREENANLVFWFRNPLSETRSILAWNVRGALLPGKVRDVFASYDGSDAFVYLDGRRVPDVYHLSPGASFMHSLLFIQTGNLDGYIVVFETLVFLPAGVLIGMDIESWFRRKTSAKWVALAGLVLPAILLELLLAAVSGRRIWAGNIALALLFGVLGVLFVNADRSAKRAVAA
jgi:glycopeptide antibiotics resistance protein